MKKSTWYRDLLVMLAALCVAGVAVVWVQRITGRIDGVAMLIFMLAVFVTSMYTDGYLWGVLASLASVLAVNFAFFTPYFAFNFTLPENLFSGTGGPDPNAPADSGKHGMGIGLSVCAAIIKAHGGEIDAESRPGEGTTIRFWLVTEKIELEDAEDEQ